MKAQGYFVLDNGERFPNTVVDDGVEAMLAAVFRNTAPVAGGNFYVGLCGNTAQGKTLTLADLTDELVATNGYARQAIARSAVGWPTLEKTASGFWRIASQLVTFTAAGGNFSSSYTRMFLCNVASGTAGKLIALGGPKPIADLVTDGSSRSVFYELFLQ